MNKRMIRHVKPLYYYYHNHPGPKATYTAFTQRVNKLGMDKEKAIQPTNKRGYIVNTEGRQCSLCKQFLSWEHFNKDKHNSTGYMCICSECSKKKKKEYRATWHGKMKTRNYKIIYSRDPEKRKLISKTYKEYRAKNKEKLDKQRKEWYEKNKKGIYTQRKERIKRQFSQGEYVLYNGQKYKLLSDYIPRVGALINVGGIKIHILKKHLKPIQTKSYLQI